MRWNMNERPDMGIGVLRIAIAVNKFLGEKKNCLNMQRSRENNSGTDGVAHSQNSVTSARHPNRIHKFGCAACQTLAHITRNLNGIDFHRSEEYSPNNNKKTEKKNTIGSGHCSRHRRHIEPVVKSRFIVRCMRNETQ